MGKRGNLEGSIRQRKDGLWEGRITMGFGTSGKQVQKSVYGKRRHEVQDKLADIRQTLRVTNGIVDRETTVSEYIDLWLKEVFISVKRSTYYNYSALLKKHVIPKLGGLRLLDVTENQIQNLVTNLAKARTPNTVNKVAFLLKKILNRAVKKRLIPFNPALDITRPRNILPQIKFLTKEESIKLINTAMSAVMRNAIILAITTGMRRGEILGLRWSDINFNEGYLIVQRTYDRTGFSTPKTEASYGTVLLTEESLSVLRYQKKFQDMEGIESDSVFTTITGTPITPRDFQRRFARIAKDAGFDKLRFHDLRHTHATLLLTKGIQQRIVQERLRHKDGRMTNRYTHVTAELQRQVLQQMGNFLQ